MNFIYRYCPLECNLYSHRNFYYLIKHRDVYFILRIYRNIFACEVYAEEQVRKDSSRPEILFMAEWMGGIAQSRLNPPESLTLLCAMLKQIDPPLSPLSNMKYLGSLFTLRQIGTKFRLVGLTSFGLPMLY